MTAPAMTCASCGRPVAVARPTCLYCGAALPEAAVAQAEAQTREVLAGPATPWTADAPAAASDRALVVVDLDGADPAAVASALGLSAYEAGQRVRGGGLQLHRTAPAAEAQADEERLRAAGLPAWVVPEAELRAALPVEVVGGTSTPAGLHLRPSQGEIVLTPADVALVVRGPIARERAPSAEIRRLRVATPETGYRFHLHRHADPRPLELDPEDFDFGADGPVTGSSMLELSSWIGALGVAVDDRFRRLPPVFAPAAPERRSLRDALGSRVRAAGEPEVPLLDNLGQFRTYSAWRAAVGRRRAAGAGRIPSPR